MLAKYLPQFDQAVPLVGKAYLQGVEWGKWKEEPFNPPPLLSFHNGSAEALSVGQVTAAAEAFLTLWAGIGLLCRMGVLMLQELSAVTETFATMDAIIRLLIIVEALVVDQARAAAEAFPTLGASKGPFTCMGALVLQKPSPLTKTFAALCASIKLLAHMEAPVLSQVGIPEAFAAEITDTGTLRCVHSLVLPQA